MSSFSLMRASDGTARGLSPMTTPSTASGNFAGRDPPGLAPDLGEKSEGPRAEPMAVTKTPFGRHSVTRTRR